MSFKEVLFLTIEYGAAPIALLSYSFIVKKQASPDPLEGILIEKQKTAYLGLDLMVIISTSPILYGLSFLGHPQEGGLNTIHWVCVGVCLLVSIVEMVVILITTRKVKEWGKADIRSISMTKIRAIWFGVILFFLIVLCKFCCDYFGEHDLGVKANPIAQLTAIGLLIIVAFLYILIMVIAYLFVNKLPLLAKKIIESKYNKANLIIAEDLEEGIKNFESALQKTPEDSLLIVDIYMKLFRVYMEKKQPEIALKQIMLLENTMAYSKIQDNSPMKMAIIWQKFKLFVSMGLISNAADLRNTMSDEDIIKKMDNLLRSAKK